MRKPEYPNTPIEKETVRLSGRAFGPPPETERRTPKGEQTRTRSGFREPDGRTVDLAAVAARMEREGRLGVPGRRIAPPPCKPGRVHEWEIPTDQREPARCRVCGAAFVFGLLGAKWNGRPATRRAR